MLEETLRLLIRPVRSEYHPRLLPSAGSLVHRELCVSSQSGTPLQVHLYSPKRQASPTVIVYLHTNSGSCLEGLPLLKACLALGLSLCVFDFAGCGNNTAKHITLGLDEADDCLAVLKEVKRLYLFENCVLWGRSMGATAAILAAPRSCLPVTALILDSAYQRLSDLLKRQCEERGLLFRLLFRPLLFVLRNRFKERTQRDMAELDLNTPFLHPIFATTPVLFLASKDDALVPCSHSESLFQAYPACCKSLIYFDGAHHCTRPKETCDEVWRFIC